MSNERQNDGRNYYCLIKLVLVEGTRLARKCVECNLPDNVNYVTSALRNRRNKMEELRRKRIISNWQMRLLYPPHSSELDFNTIDMTLWLVLARNLTTSELRDHQWKKTPSVCPCLFKNGINWVNLQYLTSKKTIYQKKGFWLVGERCLRWDSA